MNMRAIAERAGVSSATVSRVINGSSLVRPETAKRIQAILDAENFVPNPTATTLKYGRSRTYGLIIPDICNPFFAEFMGAFEQQLVEMHHEVMFTSVQSAESRLQSVRRMLTRQVDGAVIMSSEFDTEAIEPLLRHRVPLVTVDRGTVSAGCSDVSIHYDSGFRAAVDHLAQLGHQRIGYIGGLPGLKTTHVRERAYRKALEAAGLPWRAQWQTSGDYRVAGGEKAVPQLMRDSKQPTAIVTANDLTAFGAVLGAHRLGLTVPQDLSVVGFDDVLLCQVVQPPLTTVRIPQPVLSRTCIEALNYTKQDVDRRGKRFVVKPELVVRESSAAPLAGARRGA